MISTVVVLIVAVVVFIINRVPPPIVALGVALALYITGAVTFEEAIAGFGDPVVVYLAALFVVSEALEATGVTAWAGAQLIRRAGARRTTVLAALMLLVAALTALISVNGAVAALIPVGVMLAGRIGQPPAQILMPLAFAAHAGSMLTLLGTPVNLMMSDLSVEAESRPFGFFEFALVGIPLLAGTMAIVLLFGPRLLPIRSPENAPTDLSEHARTLAEHHGLEDSVTAITYSDGVTEIVIPPRSEFEGDLVYPGMLTESGNLVVVAVQRGGENLDRATLRAGDVVVLRGEWEALENRVAHAGVVAVDAPSRLRRHSVHLGPRSYAAVAVLAAMCVFLALNVAPAAIISLTAAGVMVLLRTVSVAQAQRAISLPTLLIVAGMVPLSTAIQTSGVAALISDTLLATLGAASPLFLQLGIVLVVVILGQFLSNLATVLIVAPIALTVATTADISPLPLFMGITVAGAASFITPVATAGNLMVQEPGAYRFGDYWKLGLPILALFVVVATLLVPVIWPFAE
jgi:di/tricarboxylate transporter